MLPASRGWAGRFSDYEESGYENNASTGNQVLGSSGVLRTGRDGDVLSLYFVMQAQTAIACRCQALAISTSWGISKGAGAESMKAIGAQIQRRTNWR